MMVEQNQVEKTYHIIVHGDHQQRPQPDTIDLAIDDKSARSHFRCLEHHQASNLSLLQVNIESGRKHQIRIHAASIGLPVVGDRLHGKAAELNQLKDSDDPVDLQLCAVQLKFICPTNKTEQHFSLPIELHPQLAKLID